MGWVAPTVRIYMDIVIKNQALATIIFNSIFRGGEDGVHGRGLLLIHVSKFSYSNRILFAGLREIRLLLEIVQIKLAF